MSRTFKTPRTRKLPGIFDNDSGTFTVVVRNVKRNAPTLAAAKDLRDTMRVEMKTGTFQRNTGMTVRSYYETVWLPSLTVRKPTRERYQWSMEKHVMPTFENVRLEDVIAPDLDDMVRAWMAAGMQRSTAATTITVMKALLTHAERKRYIKVNEGRLMERLPKEEGKVKKVRAMDEAQLAAFYAHIPSEFRLMFDVLLGTGMRPSELIGLEWEQVHPGHILIDRRWASSESNAPKNGSARSVPISKGLSNKLSALRMDAEGPKAGLVFPNPRGSHWNDQTLARNALNPAREGAGLPWVTLYSFRHSYVTRAYRAGVPLGDISDHVGHGDPILTWKVYRHVLESNRQSMDWLDALDPSKSSTVVHSINESLSQIEA